MTISSCSSSTATPTKLSTAEIAVKQSNAAEKQSEADAAAKEAAEARGGIDVKG